MNEYRNLNQVTEVIVIITAARELICHDKSYKSIQIAYSKVF